VVVAEEAEEAAVGEVKAVQEEVEEEWGCLEVL
jgi:hypothetical protein